MRRGAARSSGGSAGAQLTDDGDRDLAENEVARGDVATDVPLTEREDQLGQMARAVVIFRDNLNVNAPREMAVLRPLKVIIDNYPEGKT